MNLNALRLFVSVVQDGSLSKTAERLSVPVATVSRRIADLEKSLESQLFDRQKSGVKPTEAGQRLFEQVQQSIDNLAQVEQSFGAHQGGLSGRLRISTIAGMEEIWAWIEEFCRQNPQVGVNLHITDRVLDLVDDGIDFAFRVGALHTDSVVAKKVLTRRIKWLAHPDLLARLGTPQTLADLAGFPCVGYARPQQKTLWVPGGEDEVELPYVLASNDIYVIENAIKKGLGAGMLPEAAADRLIREHGLAEILADGPNSTFDVHLLYVKHRHPSRLVRAFLDFVDARLAQREAV